MHCNKSQISKKVSEVSTAVLAILMLAISVFMTTLIQREGLSNTNSSSEIASSISRRVEKTDDVVKLRQLSMLLGQHLDVQVSAADELTDALRLTYYTYALLSLIQLINIGSIVMIKRKKKAEQGSV